jgi:hypothetical protein
MRLEGKHLVVVGSSGIGLETARLALDGPRRTGDGYYESMVADSEGNRIVVAE